MNNKVISILVLVGLVALYTCGAAPVEEAVAEEPSAKDAEAEERWDNHHHHDHDHHHGHWGVEEDDELRGYYDHGHHGGHHHHGHGGWGYSLNYPDGSKLEVTQDN